MTIQIIQSPIYNSSAFVSLPGNEKPDGEGHDEAEGVGDNLVVRNLDVGVLKNIDLLLLLS